MLVNMNYTMKGKESMKKGRKMTMIRVGEETRIALNILVGEMRSEAGLVGSQNDAMWRLIKDCRPDVAERAVKLADEKEAEES
jgi:hypothetical protein